MILKGITNGLLLICALGVLIPAAAKSQNATKRSGIGFRLDENPPVNKLHSFDSLLSAHGQKYSISVTSYILPLVPQYTDTLRAFSQRGIELMDNTPTHATQFFNVLTYQDTNLYRNKPGVDHINGQKICLKYTSDDTTHPHGEGYINLLGNMVISYNPGEFHDLLPPSAYFAVYLKGPVNRLCLFYNVQSVNISDPDTLYLKSFWDETITFADQWFFRYHKLKNNDVVMHDSAVNLLGRRSLDIFDSINLGRPYTWIQPYGQYPWISPAKIKAILGNRLGFKQASSFITPTSLCYNEYNPQKIKQFGIGSEALSMESSTFRFNSHLIADAVAKHFVLFDLARLTNSYGGWNAYLQRMDSLLVWCSANNIPIRTYSQWKSLIYDSIAQKVTNIFPRLDVDMDNDGWPDGFDKDTTVIAGRFDQTDGVPYSGGKCFKINGGGTVCQVNRLAGLEKRANVFQISTRSSGNDTSKVLITVNFPEFNQTVSFEVNSDSTAWMQYQNIVYVPDSATVANFTITHDSAYHDTVKVSGIQFRSSGFLNKSKYPLQTETANLQFPSIDLSSLVIDSIYQPSEISWTFRGNHSLRFSVNAAGLMKVNKPYSFWIGRDSMYAVAQSPDGMTDSCFFRFRSDSVPTGCSGQSITISILDTITSSDYIVWTSSPYDSTMTDSTIYNPTVSPVISTMYRVMVYNLMGNINRDSIYITRHPFPVPALFPDSTICAGTSVVLTAEGGTQFLWSTGDTTASITVMPDTLTVYTVHVTNQWDCSAEDTCVIHVETVPVVKLSGLFKQYCADENCVLMQGTPWNGHFGGTSGVLGSLFCPKLANAGIDTVWYGLTTEHGCYTADTVYVTVNPIPVIPGLPDTTLYANKRLILNAGPGADNYLWSNGDTTQITIADSVNHGLGLLKIWVYVTREACVARDTARITFIKNPTAINELTSEDMVSVYPNPFNESISIVMKENPGKGDQFRLFDLRGELITSCSIISQTTTIPLPNTASGTYILLLRHGDREYFVKVVKR